MGQKSKKYTSLNNFFPYTMKFILSMSNSEMLLTQLIETSLNGSHFLEYLNHLPVFVRRELQVERKICIVLDNATIRKTPRVKNWCFENRILLLFTPKCCPICNPIENLIEFIKRQLRKLHKVSRQRV